MSALGWRIAALLGVGMFAYRGLSRFERAQKKPRRQRRAAEIDAMLDVRLIEAASGACEINDDEPTLYEGWAA